MESAKNIHAFWSQVHKYWYTEANEISTVDAQLSVVDGIGMGEAEIIYYITWRLHIDLTSEVFDDGTITDWKF